MEALVASLLRMVRDSLRDLLTSGLPSREKHLDNFFKICVTGFWRLDMATCSQLIPVAKNACFAQIGLYSRQFSKTFQFFLASRACSLSYPPLPLPKPPFSLTKPPISSSIFKKRYEFSLILKVFHVSSPRFLGFCVYVKIWKYNYWIWFYCGFVEIALWVLLVLLV